MLMNMVDNDISYEALKIELIKSGSFIASRSPSSDKGIPDYSSWETPPDEAFFAGASSVELSFGRVQDLYGSNEDTNSTTKNMYNSSLSYSDTFRVQNTQYDDIGINKNIHTDISKEVNASNTIHEKISSRLSS